MSLGEEVQLSLEKESSYARPKGSSLQSLPYQTQKPWLLKYPGLRTLRLLLPNKAVMDK